MTAVGLSDELARTAVAQVRDRTRIDDINISGLGKISLHETCLVHLIADGFTIGLIDFTTESSDRKSCSLCWMLGHTFST